MYRVHVPELAYTIQESDCHLESRPAETQTCVTLLKKDLSEIVVELKAACLSAGQSAKDCQTD